MTLGTQIAATEQFNSPEEVPLHRNGLTPLLTKSLTPSALDKHCANVCTIMEVMVRKYDKFGWDRLPEGMRKMIRQDWLHALSDYSVSEVRAACRKHTIEMPNKVPNEGHILEQIIKARNFKASMNKPAESPASAYRPPEPPKVDREAADEILRAAGYKPKRMPK